MNDWRLCQLFLGRREFDPRVFEVYVDVASAPPGVFRCTCPGWRLRRHCAHCDVVARNWAAGKPFRIRPQVRVKPPREVVGDPEAFRSWIYESTDVLMLEEN